MTISEPTPRRSPASRYPTLPFSSSTARALLLIFLAALVASPLWAQLGRVSITVADEAGEPLGGVLIRAIQDETGVDVEKTTKKNGKITFAFRNGVMNHELTLTLEGYEPLVHNIKPGSGTTYLELTLKKVDAAPASDAAAGSGGGRLTKSQEIFNEGVTALQAEDLATAEAKFLAALEEDSDLHVAHVALGGIYLETEEFDQAKASAEAALAANEQDNRALGILHEAYLGLGNQDEAEKVLERMSKLESGSDAAAIIYNEGAAALRLGENERGIERLEKALALDPSLTPAKRLLALVYHAVGREEQALGMAEQFLTAKPDDVLIQKVRWEALEALGRDVEAQAALDHLKTLDPTVLIKDFYEAGETAFNDGNTEVAKESFEKILALDPDHPQSHFFMGLISVNLGNSAAAKTHFEAFLALAPDDPQAATAREMLSYL